MFWERPQLCRRARHGRRCVPGAGRGAGRRRSRGAWPCLAWAWAAAICRKGGAAPSPPLNLQARIICHYPCTIPRSPASPPSAHPPRRCRRRDAEFEQWMQQLESEDGGSSHPMCVALCGRVVGARRGGRGVVGRARRHTSPTITAAAAAVTAPPPRAGVTRRRCSPLTRHCCKMIVPLLGGSQHSAEPSAHPTCPPPDPPPHRYASHLADRLATEPARF